jgi:hypothetical protein
VGKLRHEPAAAASCLQGKGDAPIAECEIADVRRCRKRALEFNVHPIPVFCPLDEIKERVAPELGDLNFVTRHSTNFVRQLGYTGPGWQHRVQTEWLLHTGVICWDDISHTLSATAHHPAELLKRPLQIMESAWEEMDHGKRSINSLIGLWCIDDCFAHCLVSSNDERDAPPGSLKSTFYYEGGCATDYIVSPASSLPPPAVLYTISACAPKPSGLAR